MWFFGVGDLAHRDTLADFVERYSMDSFPEGYFKEGYRPVPKGISSFMFLTNSVNPVRGEEAFLRFTRAGSSAIEANTSLGARFTVERSALVPSLRTGIGLEKMDITRTNDFLAVRPYRELDR